MKYILCDLYPLMVQKGIKSVSELQRITGLPRRTLDKCFHNDSKQIHHNTAILLCEALECSLSELYRIVDEKEYSEHMNNIKRSMSYLKKGFVYFIKDNENNLTKIGKSSNLQERIKQLKKEYGENLELIHSIKSERAIQLEKQIHNLFEKKRVIGEWFQLTNEDLKQIKRPAAPTVSPE